ncbi:MAG TPA: M15 family metallopeptidase [Gemmatimonadaceae bacterium]|nr:M15 family metallopeptidase [Gemmatimonadaceae bacterium]
MRASLPVVAIACLLVSPGCDGGAATTATLVSGEAARAEAAPDSSAIIPPYAGTDSAGIPHYVRRAFTAEEKALLRGAFGIEDPDRLYLSDSTPERLLKYDTRVKTCSTCYVNSYRVGFVSIRKPGESWDSLEARVRRTPRRDFPASARRTQRAINALDPTVAPVVRRMLAAAAAAGFQLRVTETYRSPAREAYLMARGGGRTHTLTSMHSYGRALDIVVGDGNTRHPRTRAQWIAFRRWAAAYDRGEFRIIGTATQSWDWAHIEIPSRTLGFRSIEAALARARTCRAAAGERVARFAVTPACDFIPSRAAAGAEAAVAPAP